MITPINHNVVILPDTPPDVSPGGIILPNVVEREASVGVAVAVGPGPNKDDKPMSVKAGDHVAFNLHMAQEMVFEGVTHVVIEEEHIFGILDPDETY